MTDLEPPVHPADLAAALAVAACVVTPELDYDDLEEVDYA